MNKWKKAISAGMTATLLASLFTVIAASSVSAGTAVTGVGSIGGGSTSTTTATFTFTENAAAAFLGASSGSPVFATVTITDKLSGATVHFVGSPVLTAPGSLGATVTPGDNFFTVKLTGHDDSNKEQFSVSGLKIKADTGAALGAMKATLSYGSAGQQALFEAGFIDATGTATGHLVGAVGTGAAAFDIAVDTGSCDFVTVAASLPGPLKIAGLNPETITDATVAGQPGPTANVTAVTPVTTVNHLANDVVTQAGVPCGVTTALGSPGTVVEVLKQTATSTTVNPGENNQDAGTTTLAEQVTIGYIAKGTVVTFTLAPAGVQFSASPTVDTNSVAGVGILPDPGVCNLSFDRTSCSYTTTQKATTVLGTVTLTSIKLDLASTVAAGAGITATATLSPALGIYVSSNTIAYVGRVIVGVAAQPTIFINYNDQSTGQISLVESDSAFFTDGTGSNNVFAVCIDTDETFTRAPWAVVTVGDLKLLSGLVGATSVQGTLINGGDCAEWTVYSASTVKSTIEIRGSDASNVVLPSGANNGPRLSVGGTLPPGATLMSIYVGLKVDVESQDADAFISKVSNAVRVFKSGVVVTALSQPTIPAGSTDSVLGKLTISETLPGQFKAGEDICVAVLPRTISTSTSLVQDTFIKSATTNDLPIVTSNVASGLLMDATVVSGCDFTDDTEVFNSFTIHVSQQSFGPLGVITISNVHVITTADAVNGAVLVRVAKDDGDGVDFEAVVSPARIASSVGADAWIAKGLNVRAASAFGLATVATTRGSYVTVRARIASAATGTLVQIWVKTKTTAWKLETSRRVSTDGYMYYSGKVLNLGYRYYRVNALGATSNTVRAYGK